MYHDIVIAADQYELEQTYAAECDAELALAPIAARIRNESNDFGKLIRIFTPSGYTEITRLEPHTLQVTAQGRLFVDGQDMTPHAGYWLEQLSSASNPVVVAPAGRYPAPVPRVVYLTNPTRTPVKITLQWLRSDPARVQGRRNSHHA